jgi:hypothetical protein
MAESTRAKKKDFLKPKTIESFKSKATESWKAMQQNMDEGT